MAVKKKTVVRATSQIPGPKNATKAALSKFEEGFGRDMGVALKLGARRKKPKITSTGSVSLDFALTIGGIPSGRIWEVWGPEHAGKTTLAMIIMAMHQRAYPDKVVAWVDMEQTFDDDWAEKQGVDLDRVYFYTPVTAEDVADATKRFVNSGLCSLVVLDSVGGMISRIEMEKEADEATVGKVPGIVTRMVKACSPMANINNTSLCVINQVRANIGGWGPDETTGGGWALKHVTVVKLYVKRAGGADSVHTAKRFGHEKPQPVGYKMAIKVQKNKMGPEGAIAEIWFHNVATKTYGPVGFDIASEAFDLAKRMGLLGTKGGGYYQIGEKEIRGEPAAVDHLRAHPEDVEMLRQKILSMVSHEVKDELDPPPSEVADPAGIGELV